MQYQKSFGGGHNEHKLYLNNKKLKKKKEIRIIKTKNSRRRKKFISLKLIFAYALKNLVYILNIYVFSYLPIKEFVSLSLYLPML